MTGDASSQSDSSSSSSNNSTEQPRRRLSADGSLYGPILFWGGLLVLIVNQFFFTEGLGVIVTILQYILLVAGALALGHGSIVAVIIFIFWNVFLGGTYDLNFLLRNYLPAIVIAIFFTTLTNRFTNNDNSWDWKGSISAILVLAFIFIVEVGIINLLEAAPIGLVIPIEFKYLFMSMPLWSILGLIKMRGGKFRSIMITILSIYIFIVVLSGVGFGFIEADRFAGDFVDAGLEAKAEGEKDLPSRIAVISGTVECMGGIFNFDIQNRETYAQCSAKKAKERQYKSECRAIYPNENGDSKVFLDCLAEQEENSLEKSRSISGSVDPTLNQPMKVNLDFVSNNINYFEGSSIPIRLSVENPREVSLLVEMGCNISNRKNGDIATGFDGDSKFDVTVKKFNTVVLCKPVADDLAKGKYKIEISAKIEGIEVLSHQEKAFIGNFNKKERLEKEIKESISNTKSQSASDLVHLVFSLNYGDDNDAIVFDPITTPQNLFLSSKLRNVGPGKIVNFREYAVLVDTPGFSSGGDTNKKCFGQSDVRFSKKSREILLPSCIIDDFPFDLKPVDEDVWIYKDLRAKAIVDYEIKKGMSFTSESELEEQKDIVVNDEGESDLIAQNEGSENVQRVS